MVTLRHWLASISFNFRKRWRVVWILWKEENTTAIRCYIYWQHIRQEPGKMDPPFSRWTSFLCHLLIPCQIIMRKYEKKYLVMSIYTTWLIVKQFEVEIRITRSNAVYTYKDKMQLTSALHPNMLFQVHHELCQEPWQVSANVHYNDQSNYDTDIYTQYSIELQKHKHTSLILVLTVELKVSGQLSGGI